MLTHIPHIKLLKSPLATYFYDVNKNEIVSINEDEFKYLNCIIHKKDFARDDVIEAKISDLLEKGYLSDNKPKKIKHPFSDSIDISLNRKMEKITLQLTQNCNFRCSYCIYSEGNTDSQRKHSKKTMSLEVGKKSIDFLREHSIDNNNVYIGFYGGEPLLEFKLMKELVDYSEKALIGKNINYAFTSNASLLNEEIIDYIVANNFSTMISLDGPKEINDKNRFIPNSSVSAFDMVMKNIDIIRTKYPEYLSRISFSMVMNPKDDFDTINTLFDKDSTIKDIKIKASVIDDTYSSEKNEVSENYIVKYEYKFFLATLNIFQRIDKEKLSPISISHLQSLYGSVRILLKSGKLAEKDAPSGPCVPGALRLFVDVDGNFYPCERVSESLDELRIGHIDTGFDTDSILKILNVAKLTENECKNCWAFRLCTSCVKNAMDEKGISKAAKLYHCNQIKNSAEHKLYMSTLFKEHSVTM